MDNKPDKTTIMGEHNGVLFTKHLLAIINFAAIFIGSVITLAYTLYRGAPSSMKIIGWFLVAVNALMLGVCVADFVLQRFFGTYHWALLWGSYALGGIWLLLLILRIVFGMSETGGGGARIDLIAISAVQLVIAFLAYFVWASLDRYALDSMMRKSVRGNAALRKKKSVIFIAVYGGVCALIVLAQFCSLLFYKLPPTVYDLFADNRALEYRLVDEGQAYEVTDVYVGTAKKVTIPATFNNLPVVGIASDAITAANVETIELGTTSVNEAGESEVVSNLRYIESGAIKNDRITAITVPESVTAFGAGAITGTNLKTMVYEARADFSFGCINCPNLTSVTMNGANVGKIVSLDGIGDSVTIQVNKSIYNDYRSDNPAYTTRFKPLLDENEFCIDFYTGCDYYINSIFSTTPVTLGVNDLVDPERGGALSLDSNAYYADKFEVNTNGAKANAAFRGWYGDENFTSECVLSPSLTVMSDLSLYAKWVDEYSATLDWGNYIPLETEGVRYRFGGAVQKWDLSERTVYWTDEEQCTVTFPEVSGRTGYANGVQWKLNGKNVSTSKDILSGDHITAAWLLDAPTVDIESQETQMVSQDYRFDSVNNELSFTYDENNKVTLHATYDHPLGNANEYTYMWRKQNGDHILSTQANFSDVNEVNESGIYTLTVTATSVNYHESSSASADIYININKKDLPVGNASLSAYNQTYTAQKQSADLNEKPNIPDTTIVYEYVDNGTGSVVSSANDSYTQAGVTNAGNYTLQVTIKKNTEEAAANYEEKVFKAAFIVTPAQITGAKWTRSWGGESNTTTYNGGEQYVTATFEGLLSADSADAVYLSERATNAGTYNARVAEIGNKNYTFDGSDSVFTYSWTINKKQVKITGWGNGELTYNGNVQTIEASIGYGSGADQICEVDRSKISLAYNDNSRTDAGTYNATVALAGDTYNNYTLAAENSQKSWTIAKKTLTASKADTGAVNYNGTQQTVFRVAVNGFVSKDVPGVTSSDLTTLFDFGTTSPVTETFALSASASASGQTVNIDYKAVNAGTYNCELKGIRTSGIMENYTLTAGVESGSATIGKRKLTLSAQGNGGSYEYNGNTQKLTVAVQNILPADIGGLTLGEFNTSGGFTGGEVDGNRFLLVFESKDVGNHSVTVDEFLSSGKLSSNYTITRQVFSLNITKKQLTITGWTLKDGARTQNIANDGRIEYTGQTYTIEPVLSGVQGSDSVILTLAENSTARDAKAYSVEASLGAQYSNYSLGAANNTLKFTIDPHAVKASFSMNGGAVTDGKQYTYNGQTRTVTASVTAFASDEVHVTISDAKNSSAKDVGTYVIKASSLQLDGAQSENYKLDYSSSDNAVSWSITPATVTVSWTNMNKYEYNGSYQGPTFTLTGLVDADLGGNYVRYSYGSGSSVSGNKTIALGGNRLVNLSDANLVDAGSYNITVSGIYKDQSSVNGNYTVSAASSSASFEITQKAVRITDVWKWSDGSASGVLGSSLVYRSKQYTVTTEIEEDSVISADKASLTLLYGGNTGTTVNDYTARITGLGGAKSNNYTIAEYTHSWKITPKAINFEWDSQGTFTYNGSSQKITATLASQTSDTADDSDGKVCYADRGSVSPVYQDADGINAKSYTAKVTGLTGNKSANYVIAAESSGKTKIWTIDPLTITASQMNWEPKTFVYDGTVQTPSATYVYNGVTVKAASYDSKGITKDVGEKTIKVTGLDNANFKIHDTDNSHSYSVSARTVEIAWDNAGDFVYDGSTHTVTARVTNAASGEQVTLTLENNSLKDAKSYTVTIKSVSNSNYKLGSGTQKTITVKPRPLAFSWTGGTYTYDGNSHTVTASITNLAPGDGGSVSVKNYDVKGQANETAVSTASLKDAGNYTVTVKEIEGASSGNYTLSGGTDLSKSYTVNKKQVTLRWTGDGSDGRTVTFKSENGVAKEYKLTVEVLGVENADLGTHSVTLSHSGRVTLNAKSEVTLKDNNYTYDGLSSSQLTKTLEVVKQRVRISWTLDGRQWSGDPIENDGGKHTLTAKITGAEDVGENPEITFKSSTSGNFTSVGSHTVTITSLDNSDYTLEGAEGNVSATLVINAKAVESVFSEVAAPVAEFGGYRYFKNTAVRTGE